MNDPLHPSHQEDAYIHSVTKPVKNYCQAVKIFSSLLKEKKKKVYIKEETLLAESGNNRREENKNCFFLVFH